MMTQISVKISLLSGFTNGYLTSCTTCSSPSHDGLCAVHYTAVLYHYQSLHAIIQIYALGIH